MMGLMGLMMGAGAAFATATVGGEEATAMPCCSSCDSAYEYCYANCTTPSCYDTCETRYIRCSGYCSWSC
ncbi:hypothetical protein [Pyxidicoccus xibeiensis]|uniref:hypothetical protein n=1 Tax=Pyxidicoccus xibeiensis TaxID=2906759 RepID=UPI0020A780D5|nr:hypothetical protein [Pyxidicoccus xibeiensis]MCP3144127.1 hypothetical protein [Pyxidicoccus xibeiensis]